MDDFVDRIGTDHVGPYWISTVYLKGMFEALERHVEVGLDMEILGDALGGWYETGIFNEDEVEDTKIFRWKTEETARIGHRQMVEALTDIVRAGEQIDAVRKAARKAGFDL